MKNLSNFVCQFKPIQNPKSEHQVRQSHKSPFLSFLLIWYQCTIVKWWKAGWVMDCRSLKSDGTAYMWCASSQIDHSWRTHGIDRKFCWCWFPQGPSSSDQTFIYNCIWYWICWRILEASCTCFATPGDVKTNVGECDPGAEWKLNGLSLERDCMSLHLCSRIGLKLGTAGNSVFWGC